MRILIINWRSIKDKNEGGAERATFEFAKVWVKDYGATVYWLSPPHDENIRSETIEGINFIYTGLPLSRNIFALIVKFPLFYFSVIFKYLTTLKGRIDVVIDQVHGIPYLTPLYVKEKKAVYIHEVAGAIWDIMYPIPINWLGKIVEKLFFSFYKDTYFIANSQSTCKDLGEKLKISSNNIGMVQYGVTAPINNNVPQKEKELTVVYLNRIVKMKGIERAIESFSLLLNIYPKAQMWVIGTGEEAYINTIKNLVAKLSIGKSIHFLGFVDGDKKFELLGKAHVLVNPSYLEGWGLVNIEANRMATPVVAFKVKGCVDSVIEGVSGYLTEDNDVKQFTQNIIKAYNNETLRKTSLEYSQQFYWSVQAKKFYETLETL